MMPRSPTIHAHPRCLWLRHTLISVAFAAALALGSSRGGLVLRTAAETAVPATGHAQVIAQAVVDLSDASLAWTVVTIDAGEHPTDVLNNDAPGFLLGTEGTAMVRDRTGARTHLAAGEAVAVRSDDALKIQAASADPASVSLLTLDRAGGNDLDAAITAGGTFASPGGSRDVELVGAVLAEDETARTAASDSPIFVLVTGGAVAIEADADETQELDAGDTALVTGPLVVTGTAKEPSSFVAAVIGADVDAPVDAESATLTTGTAFQQTPSDPAPSPSPAPSSTPAPSPAQDSPTPTPAPPTPTPIPDGDDPDDDPDEDYLPNYLEYDYGTDRRDPDTDDDGLLDGYEVGFFTTNPTVYDTDGDGFGDGDEIERIGTNPTRADSDDDGLTDRDDFDLGADPLKYDTDGDGVGDGDELLYNNTDPLNPDTDNDGLNDSEEAFLATDPRNPDTDGDGYSDGAEVYVHRTWATDPESHP